jgi:exopolysaccharide production protein ExoZ
MHATKIDAVQALRAMAALSIAVLHVLNDAISLDPSGQVARWHAALPWAAGVDLFFVISGFVMVYASTKLFGHRGSPGQFMARRLIRIVPLYWAATTLFLLIAMAAPSTVSEGAGSMTDIAMSYAFLPARRPGGSIQPIYSLGWTLNYEMFFYAVFAACIWQPRRRAIALVSLLLGAAIALHRLVPEHAAALVFWTDPIVAEFLFGMAIAVIASANVTLSTPVRVGLVTGALALLTAGDLSDIRNSEPITTGIPMAMLLAGTALGRQVRMPRALTLLGDASYALYLVHPFAMRPVGLLWHHLYLSGPIAATAYAGVALLLSIAGSICVYLWFERPVGAWLRARLVAIQVRQAAIPRAVT